MTPGPLPLLPLVLSEVPPLLRRMLRQEGMPTVDQGTGPHGGRFVLFDSKCGARPTPAAGQTPLDVDEVRRRLGFDPWSDHDARRTCRSVWRVGPYEAGEETAATDYGALRRATMPHLRRLVEVAGGVWARLAPFPTGYRSAFCFRFDHDAYVADDFNAVLSAIAGHEEATTHFVCGSTHGEHLGALDRLDGLDVGSHGFYHHTYLGAAENHRNIARGIDVLRNAGIDPSGFAAPHGRNPAGLSGVLAELGITHSSEFAAAYDDLPFREGDRKPWQIPIHPVCLGIVLESLAPEQAADPRVRQVAADAVADNFVAVADAKRAAGELTVLYGHPDGRLGRYPHIVRSLLDHVGGHPDVWRTNLTSLAWWFDLRDRERWTLIETADGWMVRRPGAADLSAFGATLSLELHAGGDVATVPLDGRPTHVVRRSQLRPAATPPITPLPRPIRREFLSGIRPRLRRWLDWERTTPIAEIAADHWRGRLKRTLRRVTA
jgi:hypothetical protein